MKKQDYMRLGFPELIDVSGRITIADLFTSSKRRTGIYLLHFPDGDYYVGQAVDVVRRFSQHIKEKGPISGFSFFPVPKETLDQQERYCIIQLEHKCNLKNISLVTMPEVETDFDAVLSRQDQLDWLNYDSATPWYCSRNQDKALYEQLRKKYAAKFSALLSDKYFKKCFLPVMQKYFKCCIPEPCLTEMSFWNCSCLPSYSYNPDIKILSRINLRSAEVFTVGYYRDPVEVFYSFHACKSPFKELPKAELDQIKKQFPSLVIDNHNYPSAGEDQWNLDFGEYDEVMNALDHPVFLKAIKSFNLGQMRKGATLYHGTHCVDLADLLLSAI